MDILQIIQTVGFPVACVIGMGWYVKYITDQHREDRNAADIRHANEIPRGHTTRKSGPEPGGRCK